MILSSALDPNTVSTYFSSTQKRFWPFLFAFLLFVSHRLALSLLGLARALLAISVCMCCHG